MQGSGMAHIRTNDQQATNGNWLRQIDCVKGIDMTGTHAPTLAGANDRVKNGCWADRRPTEESFVPFLRPRSLSAHHPFSPQPRPSRLQWWLLSARPPVDQPNFVRTTARCLYDHFYGPLAPTDPLPTQIPKSDYFPPFIRF